MMALPLLLAVATASISFTICEMKVFAGFRERIAARSQWLGELFAYAFCLSHRIALGLVAVYLSTRGLASFTPQTPESGKA